MDKLDIKENMIFISADGDGIGRKVGRSVIANDIDSLHKISARIDAAQDFILHWTKQHDGVKISGGGDEFTAAIPAEHEDKIEGLRKDIEHAFGYTISVGVGKSLSEAGTALLVAKLRGKDRIVHFSKEIEQDIKDAKKRVKKGKASQEEYKLSEAYLEKSEKNMGKKHEEKKPEIKEELKNSKEESEAPKKEASAESSDDCEYCKKTDGVDKDHCKYCHDMDKEEGLSDCPYCQKETEELEGNIADAGDDRTEDPKKGDVNSGATMEPPKGDPGANDSAASNDVLDPSDIPAEESHSKEAMQAIAQEIQDQSPVGEKPVMDNVDDADLAIGSDMEGNTSRPADFDTNTPGDLGIASTGGSEEESDPNLGEVLQEGLDNGADDIAREKVVQMASQDLKQINPS